MRYGVVMTCAMMAWASAVMADQRSPAAEKFIPLPARTSGGLISASYTGEPRFFPIPARHRPATLRRVASDLPEPESAPAAMRTAAPLSAAGVMTPEEAQNIISLFDPGH